MIRIETIIKHTSKRIALKYPLWRGLLILAMSFSLFTCINETDALEETSNEENAWLFVTVNLPQPSLPATRQADTEQEITDIRIMIFELVDNIYKFSYQVSGSQITPIDNGSQFKASLKTTDIPLKLVILANVEGTLASYEPLEGATEANIREEIEIPFPAGGLWENLPMYGEATLPNGIGANDNYISLNALRAIARVDVEKQLEEGSGDFILEEVQIFRAYNAIQLIPDDLPDPSAPKVVAPSIPEDAVFLDNPVIKSVAGGTDAIANVYVPESYPAGNGIAERDGTTVVVVGGRFAGSDQTTYYRADFNPGVEGHPFGQVLRNHRYNFIIKKVSAPGWSTAIDAANNFTSSIVVEISAWEDFASELYFGDNRFAVSSRDISLPYIENRHKQIDVESTLPYTIQWLDASGNPTGESTSAQDVDISNNNFSVRIIKENDDSEEASHLQFRTLNNNAAGSTVITNTLRITINKWTVDITVRQENRAVYSDFYVNVLSARLDTYYVGNLGTTMTYPTYDPTWAFAYGGLGMRMILQRHFVPGGVIGIGGFRFEEITQSSRILLNVTDQTSLNNLEQFLDMQDVIYLTYAVVESTAAAQLIMAWLNKNTKRVLILGTDNAATNANVVSLFSGDATWVFTNLSDGYVCAATTDQNRVFFSGPFGTVTSGTSVSKYDNTSGHSQVYSSDVTPLIVSSTNSAIMYFGVNKRKRIVYHGDANLYHTNQISNHSGNVSSNTDRLMSNVWAWIIDQVIYGDD